MMPNDLSQGERIIAAAITTIGILAPFLGWLACICKGGETVPAVNVEDES